MPRHFGHEVGRGTVTLRLPTTKATAVAFLISGMSQAVMQHLSNNDAQLEVEGGVADIADWDRPSLHRSGDTASATEADPGVPDLGRQDGL